MHHPISITRARLGQTGGLLALLLVTAQALCLGEDYTITTLAGKAGIGHSDGPRLDAMFNQPKGIAVAASGVVYVADSANHVIRKIATDGTVSTLAGSPGLQGQVTGDGAAARFKAPQAIAIHPTSGHLFVVEIGHAILEINPDTGAVTIFAGSRTVAGTINAGLANSYFSTPRGLCFDVSGTLFVADSGNHRIRTITAAGVVGTLAGNVAGYLDASGTTAAFNLPSGIALGSDVNLYVTDTNNHRVRKLTPAGVVTTLAGNATAGTGDGTGAAAGFISPTGIIRMGSDLAVSHGGRVRMVTLAGVVTTYQNHTGTTLADLALSGSGTLLVPDSSGHVIREFTAYMTGSVFAGISGYRGSIDGTASMARFANPGAIAATSDGTLTFLDGGNYTIRQMTAAGIVSTLAGSPGMWGHADGTGATARFKSLSGLALAADGTIYVSDSSASVIRKITAAGVASTLAGMPNTSGFADGSGTSARFGVQQGMAIDSGGDLYVADAANRAIRKVTQAGVVTTFSGHPTRTTFVDGPSNTAGFAYPQQVAIDRSSGVVYVADTYTVRRISTSGEVTTIAGLKYAYGYADGIGAAARFGGIDGLMVGAAGEVFVLDSGNSTLRKLVPASGEVTTLAGLAGVKGSADGAGPVARFYSLGGVTAWNGDLYLTESGNCTIRKATPPSATPPGPTPTPTPTPAPSSSASGGGGGCGVGSAVAFILLCFAAVLPLRLRRTRPG